jgi:hypothetical protein
MTSGTPEGLRLTEEEAFSLLGLCLTSPQGLDATSEKALRKLAEYCTKRSNSSNSSNHNENHQPQAIHLSVS